MKISVLIAAYQAGRYVPKALESIRVQEHTDWEVVVVEDGSSDETEEVVKRFADTVAQPVRYENLGRNRGVAVARSRLLELSQGDAVAFLDADDWWTPQHLFAANKTIANGAGLAVSPIQMFDLDSGGNLETYTPASALFSDPVNALFQRSWIMTSSSVALSRKAVEQTGSFDSRFRIGEDRDYWLRAALGGTQIRDTGKLTCFYAKHAGSTMARTVRWAEQEVAFYEKHFQLSAVALSRRKELLAHSLSNYGRLIRKENPQVSLRSLWHAARLTPFTLSRWPQLALSAASAGFRASARLRSA